MVIRCYTPVYITSFQMATQPIRDRVIWLTFHKCLQLIQGTLSGKKRNPWIIQSNGSLGSEEMCFPSRTLLPWLHEATLPK